MLTYLSNYGKERFVRFETPTIIDNKSTSHNTACLHTHINIYMHGSEPANCSMVNIVCISQQAPT